jgi:hypothetical protein
VAGEFRERHVREERGCRIIEAEAEAEGWIGIDMQRILLMKIKLQRQRTIGYCVYRLC